MAKVRDGEKLDKVNILRVIGLLEQEKPITKKAACEMLNITYNTSRLAKLIEEFKTREENAKKRRAKLRGKPLSDQELAMIAQEYLTGMAISNIAELTYRPTTLIKKAINSLNIPIKEADRSYYNPNDIEPEAMAEDYERDDLVYSARYQCPALINSLYKVTPEGSLYNIYLLGPNQCCAIQPFWELADLRRVQKDLNVKIRPMDGLPPSYNPPNLKMKAKDE